MIRITELPLPLDYTPEALRQAVVKRLKIRDAELLELHAVQTQLRRAQEEHRHPVHLHRRRDGDRRGGGAQALRARPADRRRSRHHLSPGGEGACGARRSGRIVDRLRSRRFVCRAAAGADGLQAHRARAWPRRAPAHAGHLGAVAQEDPDARIQRAVRRGRGGPVLRRQALQPDQGSEVLRPQGDARVRARGRAARKSSSSASRTSALSASPASSRRCARKSSRSAARCASKAR